MAKKIIIDKDLESLKKALTDEKVVFGTEKVIKLLRDAKLRTAYMSSNTPEKVRQDIDKYTRNTGAEMILLKYPNDELGTLCKKPFNISVVGVLR